MNQDHLEEKDLPSSSAALSPERKDVGPLERYIGEGITLIKERKFEEAERHFGSVGGAKEFGVNIALGENRYIESLRTEEDLIKAVLRLAGQFRRSEKGFGIQFGVYVGQGGFLEPFADPDFYKPAMVERFHYEMALFHSEEWLHYLQVRKEGPIAGQENDETDVAAYLYEQGVSLSIIFLTRYPERTDWYLGLHPERAEELLAFQKKWGSVPRAATPD